MKVHARFITSAADPARFPLPVAPEIAFLGRSNVGKSSLLNSLVGGKLAHVSSTPGRTRTINFFAVSFAGGRAKQTQPDLVLADLPGYGYAKLSKTISAEWPKFIDPYLAEREPLVVCVVLIDLNVPAQASDSHLLEFLRSHNREFILVGTKADKLSNNQLASAVKKLKEDLEVDAILPYSAKTDSGRNELWRAIRGAAEK